MKGGTHWAAALFMSAVSPAALAQDAPRLALPLDCKLGDTCLLQSLVDHDTGPGYTDYRCEGASYDTHGGTDFRISWADLRAGVVVLAAAPGRVAGVRDGFADVSIRHPNAPDLNGLACGNGVAIDHGGGWVTQYCHLALGSLAVRQGQTVTVGDPLGQVGLSGRTEYPHVHLTLFKDGAKIDPFRPSMSKACGADGSLWRDDLTGPPGGVMDAGFAAFGPTLDDVAAGTVPVARLPGAVRQMAAFAVLTNVRDGDTLGLTIDGPTGRLRDLSVPLPDRFAQGIRSLTMPRPEGGWPPGSYAATFTLTRDGNPVHARTVTTTIVR